MSTARKGAYAVYMPDGIYILGGYDGCNFLKSCEKYCFNTKSWTNLPKMNLSKAFFTAHINSTCQYIYTIGGFDGKPLNIIER